MSLPPDHDGWSGVGTGWTITSTLIAGILVGGGVGFLVDRLVGTPRVFAAIGIVAGSVAGIYVVYLRYGRSDGGND